MKILLDTNYLIFNNADKSKIPYDKLKEIEYHKNKIYISFASWFELGHLVRLGKINLGMNIDEFFFLNKNQNGFKLLNYKVKHMIQYAQIQPLPHHKDPFDLMILSQAIVEQMIIYTTDRVINQYFDS